MRTLREAPFGESVKVRRIGGDGPMRKRIMDMGITRGCFVRVNGCAPFGDPLEVTVRGYELSLRRSEAELIEIE